MRSVAIPLHMDIVRMDESHEAREGWRDAVSIALQSIEAGMIRKVVLARSERYVVLGNLSTREVLAALLCRTAGPYYYASDGLVGSSPELLVAVAGSEVRSQPLAGTVANASPKQKQLSLPAEWSPKCRREHSIVVDDVARRLATVTDNLTIGEPAVISLGSISHLGSTIIARKRTRRTLPPAPPPGVRSEKPDDAREGWVPTSALEFAAMLHPTPAVGGEPWPQAASIIRTVEGIHRGRYAGPVGWVSANGDGEWAIALRGVELTSSRLTVNAGAGIVDGSDVDDEWNETANKINYVTDALTGDRTVAGGDSTLVGRLDNLHVAARAGEIEFVPRNYSSSG